MTSNLMTRGMLALTAVALSLTAMAEIPAEYRTEARSRGNMMLKHHDADGDGTITLQEFKAGGDEMFARLDADGDGRLSADELAAAHSWRHPGRGERGNEAPRDGKPAGQRGQRGFQRMDADGDGFVGREEFDEARMARFSRLDANGNGVIDADELPQHKGGRRAHGKRASQRGADTGR